VRFNALVFIGDDAARSIYAAFNILLTKDLELGAWRSWEMELVHKKKCRCESMFALAKGGTGPLEECGMFELTGTHQLGGWPDPYVFRCGSHPPLLHFQNQLELTMLSPAVPHPYILASQPSYGGAVDEAFVSEFKDLLCNKPRPWQPSPMIFALSTGIGSPSTVLHK
jgi:hypothetical protein